MSRAHGLDILERVLHILLKLHIDLLFVPHESLDVLPKSTAAVFFTFMSLHLHAH